MSVTGLMSILVILAAVSDIQSRRIPNALNFVILLSGIAVASMGWSELDVGALSSLLGALSALAILLMPFALDVYRGGDVKLCIGMGAWLGVKGVLWAIGLGVVGGGLLGLIMLGARGKEAKGQTVPMAVCFSLSGIWVAVRGAPPW